MEGNNEVVYLYLDDIIPNRFQPREIFDDQALKELAVSIKEHGVIQPIIVRKVENKYEIIAGERRYKASTMAGLTKIPAIVKNLDDKESSKVALIENLQRRDLTPIEEARTYQKILELESNMTQEQLAQTMGKTQSVVSNKLRLLALPEEVQEALLKEKISERHARSLLNVTDKNNQIKLLDKIIAERMTVRELDKEIKDMNDNQGQNIGSSSLFDSMLNSIGTNESVNASANNTVGGMFANGQIASNDAISPTTVDINKLRESAVDIGGPKVATVDVKDLMKDVNKTDANNGFKFVNNEENSGKPLMTPENNKPSVFDNNFSDIFANTRNNLNQTNTANQNVASSMAAPNPFNLSPLNNKKDVTVAVNDIKDVVKTIETKGYRVALVENESADSYEITIKVDKN